MRASLKSLFYVLASFCLLVSLHASAEPTLNINNTEEHYVLSNTMQYRVDDTAQLSLPDVLQAPSAWQTSENGTINLSFTRAALWAKLTLHNSTNDAQDLLLVIAQPLLLDIQMYEQNHAGAWEKRASGINNINADNSLRHRLPNFSLQLQAQETKTVIYRITASNLVFPLSVWKKEAFRNNDHIDQYIKGFYYGMLAVVGIYNFLMFFIVREKSHLYYVFYLASFISAMACIEGVIMENHGEWVTRHALLLLYALNHLMLFFLCFYAAIFLDIPKFYPRIFKWMKIAAFTALLTIPIPFVLGVHGFDIFHTVLASVVCTLVLGVGTYLLFKGNVLARYFMVSWVMLLVGALTYMMTILGFLPHNFLTGNAIQIGSVFEAILQSLGLAAKIAQMKKDSLAAQAHALELQKQSNIQLEDKVRERTHALEGLTAKLAKYLSPQVYSSIFSGQNDVRVETRRKKLTVFFSDIKGFTEMTDNLESEVLSGLLNNYLDEMAQIALRHGGTIDKFIGDAVMVFFGDPETRGEKEDAIACVHMALEMRDRMVALRAKWKNEGIYKPLHIRCGINTGYCTVGNFGCESRMDYTIVGGQVNLASRLESNAEPDQILISHETFALIKDVMACDEKGEITVKGIARPIQTYQVIDLQENVDHSKRIISAQHEGFAVNIDMHKTSRKQAAAYLRELMEQVEQ
ncbi:MAG TPA: 7TM diverse intracellular signaling domain-containing protein [Pseudomonadales bacterium]|jgi:adenylate cyclase|nr:7TM diverse intracellular signaling domain-containing protein [Pseudomonadales bacterium]HRG49417.1 7TM diverse intracellular signaling domain-containing protein [Pseudomonadales bacterium]